MHHVTTFSASHNCRLLGLGYQKEKKQYLHLYQTCKCKISFGSKKKININCV